MMDGDMNTNMQIADVAKAYLNTKEFPGARSNPAVEKFFALAGHPGLSDDVPWCAAFVGAVLAECGINGSGSLMARSYVTWGAAVARADAQPFDVVVIPRGAAPKGHVFFFLEWKGDRVVGLGGNQGDAVSIREFPAANILAIRRADPAAATGRATLRLGDRGVMVDDLQGSLARLRYFAGRQDGAFGALTQAAVLAFQADQRLDADGIVGPRTWAALRTASPRVVRDVTAADLRASGSATVRNADLIDTVAGAGAGVGVLATVTEVVQAAEQAEGALAVVSRIVVEHWPALLVCGALAVVVLLSRRIRAARVQDARTGAHMGR